MTKKVSAGQDIIAMCGKCKLATIHVIHAVVDDVPARVECKSCRAVHRYRPDPADKKAVKKKTRSTTSKSRTRGPTKAEKTLAEYEALIEGHDEASAEAYHVKKTFEVDQLIKHRNFGIGIVLKVLLDRKIEVRFKEETKTLVHDR